MTAARRAALAGVVILWTGLLLLACAILDGRAPWSPASTHVATLDAAFVGAPATAAHEGEAVRVEGADAQGMTRLEQALPELDASQFRYLRYDVDAPSPGAKLMLVWRGSEGQGVALLPRASFAGSTLDLTRFDAWRGRIASLAVASAPVDYLPAAALESSSLRLRSLRLESPSLRGALAARWTDWSATRPWSGRSNNTGGFELAPRAGPSLPATLVAWLCGVALLLFVFAGRVVLRRRVLPGLVFAAMLMLAGLQARELTARSADAASARRLAATRDLPLAAHPQLAVAALAIARELGRDGARPRVFVHGQGRFAEYPAWLLRELDVAALAVPEELPPPAYLDGTYLVLTGPGDWTFDPSAGQLQFAGRPLDAELAVDAGVMKAYRLASTETPPWVQ